ncbi:MAG: vanadium-dependent haloperoxidase [Bacteroidota bacterium]
MKKTVLAIFSIVICSLFSCETTIEVDEKRVNNPVNLHASVQQLTDVIVHDIFSPPAASRIYAYPSIAAYEALLPAYEEYLSFAGQLNELEEVPQPEEGKEYCFPLAAVHAFLTCGKALVFSEDMMESFEEETYSKFKDMGLSTAVYENSMNYGKAVADHILAWSAEDNYKETRTFPRYTFDDEPDSWKPTPPAYMDGIEPHWKTIRTFVLDSANQFVPPPPTPYDMSPKSQFFKELMEVYEAVKNLNEERAEIASFWDCNPYVSHQMGHVMFATKKITPGGHWIGITKIASNKAGADLMETAEAYAITSIALADGFISCWDEKWRSVLIRPETVINEHVDEDWAPLLQTPPFPEYTSGHSVISSAASVALTGLFGDNFSFIDSTEVKYGLPVRSFDSFYDASEEAAISRLYGGIHYMPAIENGVLQGKDVGNWIIENIQTKK